MRFEVLPDLQPQLVHAERLGEVVDGAEPHRLDGGVGRRERRHHEGDDVAVEFLGDAQDVDAPADPVWFEADENQIRQIIWNLATNGLRAMTGSGRLVLGVAADGNDVVLSVQDHGCGIPAEELDSIFQPFRSSFEKGTGLGLAIVHRIVTDYNGTIQVSSSPGGGTTVQVRLPQALSMAVAR
jgi:signal transduction histidine kinase